MVRSVCPRATRLTLVGGFRLEHDGSARVIGVSGRRLLAFLGTRGRSTRAVVAGELWGESNTSRAAGSLRTALWRLRRQDVPIVERDGHLALSDDVEVDVARFRSVVDRMRAGAVLADSELDPAGIPYGDLLPGWSDAWVLTERERVHHLRLHGLELLADALVRRGRLAEAVDAAAAAVDIDPLRESSTRLLVETHLRRGEVHEARRRLSALRRALADELGVDPSPDLCALLDRRHRGDGRGRPVTSVW